MSQPNYPLIERWTAALRSGHYQQGRQYLVQPPGESGTDTPLYCCLGVLLEIVKDETCDDIAPQDRAEEEALAPAFANYVFGSYAFDSGPRVVINKEAADLAVHNDGHEPNVTSQNPPVQPKTFLQIADAVDQWAAREKELETE